ncbi:hypothetical protein [Paucibacter soli]|uniref:hypothetical protein n=1 Tax=Paucibacter soli TaxID=3133433 RepID=UPI0030A36730
MQPLNGTKTRPLTAFALAQLRGLAQAPKPRQELNPGVANRLLREALVESVDLPSPYASHKGRSIEHLKASVAGIAVLAEVDGGPRYSDSLDADDEREIFLHAE